MLALLNLPDELVMHILGSFSNSKTDILNFARTCHRSYALAEPFIFHSILIRRGSDVRTLRLLLERNETRKDYVQDVILVPFTEEQNDEIGTVATTLATLPKLEHLRIEIPYSQAAHPDSPSSTFWEDLRKSICQLGGHPGRLRLPIWCSRLISCHLNLQLSSGLPLDIPDLAGVLAAPCIKNVTLVNADLSNFQSRSYNIRRRTSTLETLSLQQCLISPEAALDLLSIPRALKTFSFSAHWLADENLAETETDEMDRIHCLLTALSLHRRSLFSLTFAALSSFESLDTEEKASRLTFSNLHNLRQLELRFFDLDDNGIHASFPFLPHSLTHLKIAEDSKVGAESLLYAASMLLNDKTLLSSLRIFDVEYSPRPPEVPADVQEMLGLVGVRLKASRGLQFRVFRLTEQRNAVPPYLYDEYEPESVLVHDNYCIDRLWENKSPGELVMIEQRRKEQEAAQVTPLHSTTESAVVGNTAATAAAVGSDVDSWAVLGQMNSA